MIFNAKVCRISPAGIILRLDVIDIPEYMRNISANTIKLTSEDNQ